MKSSCLISAWLRRAAALAFVSAAAMPYSAACSATPKLFVFKGTDSNCDVAAISTPFRNMIGRIEDGQIVFLSQDGRPDDAWNNVDWEMGCYQNATPNVAVSVPLAYPEPSSGGHGLAADAHTLQDVAAGQLDPLYKHMAADIVQRGFPNAYIRLGWEYNGSWYNWAAAPDKQAFKTAYARIARIFKATVGSKFTIILNPTMGQDTTGEYPTSGVDQVGWDIYKNQYNIGQATSEPAQYQNAYSGWWGISSMATWQGGAAHAVPEFGVGGGLGDDGVFMADALAYFQAEKVSFVGYWDSTASYDGVLSDGSKPSEALEYLKVFGPGIAPALLKGATLYTGPFTAQITNGTGLHGLPIQLASGALALYFWSDTSAAQVLNIATSLPKTAERVNLVNGQTSILGNGEMAWQVVYAGGGNPGFLIFK